MNERKKKTHERSGSLHLAERCLLTLLCQSLTGDLPQKQAADLSSFFERKKLRSDVLRPMP